MCTQKRAVLSFTTDVISYIVSYLITDVSLSSMDGSSGGIRWPWRWPVATGAAATEAAAGASTRAVPPTRAQVAVLLAAAGRPLPVASSARGGRRPAGRLLLGPCPAERLPPRSAPSAPPAAPAAPAAPVPPARCAQRWAAVLAWRGGLGRAESSSAPQARPRASGCSVGLNPAWRAVMGPWHSVRFAWNSLSCARAWGPSPSGPSSAASPLPSASWRRRSRGRRQWSSALGPRCACGLA